MANKPNVLFVRCTPELLVALDRRAAQESVPGVRRSSRSDVARGLLLAALDDGLALAPGGVEQVARKPARAPKARPAASPFESAGVVPAFAARPSDAAPKPAARLAGSLYRATVPAPLAKPGR